MDTQEKTTCLPNGSKWAIFFPYTNESKNRTAELENHIRKMGYGCIRILGKWGCAKTEDTTFATIDEESLFIPNMTYEEAISLGTKYDQIFVIKVSQENYVELTAASAIPNKEIKSPQILRY